MRAGQTLKYSMHIELIPQKKIAHKIYAPNLVLLAGCETITSKKKLFFSSSSLIITENEFFSALNALQSKEHKLYDTLLYIFF